MSISVTDPSGTEWVARDRDSLVKYLKGTASKGYRKKVLSWYDASTGLPFMIQNGSDTETWDIGPIPAIPHIAEGTTVRITKGEQRGMKGTTRGLPFRRTYGDKLAAVKVFVPKLDGVVTVPLQFILAGNRVVRSFK